MRIYLPNSASLGNFGGFARRQDPADPTVLDFSMDQRWVYVHPAALAMAAAAARTVVSRGGEVRANLSGSDSSLRYLDRMKLTDAMGVESGLPLTEHAPEGRFIPISQITDQAALNAFIVEMVPLLHATPEEAGPIKYVVTELVRNVLEHAASPIGAMVSAQYYAQTQRLAIGVADAGIGIRRSIALSHAVNSDLEAISLALRPGVTGTTTRLGGNEQNAGAGLFFTKSIARVARQFFVIYSGSAMFKLRPGPQADAQPTLFSDPAADPATRESDLPHWAGTVIGIDISIATAREFSDLLAEIRDAYHLDVGQRRRQRYRRPRFG